MKKPILFFLFLLFCSIVLNAQKVYYSAKEKSAFDYTYSHIIGKIKNNILVWKYIYPGKNFELLVYDYNMHLQHRIPLKAFHSFSYENNLNFDFINRQNYFDVLVQYNSGNTFYCNTARFDENGQLMLPIKTIESSKLQGESPNSYEQYSIIQSENRQYTALVNAISESDGMMEVTFLILDKDLNCLKKGNALLPFNNTHTVLSPVCLDNNGNILLAEASNTPFVSSNIITVYKVEKNNDTISNIVHDVGKKMISDLSMKVDDHNNEYFVYAVAANEEDAVNTFQQEMLSILLNPDLTEKATDQFSILNNTQKDSALNNYENLFISTISRNDSGYEIVCFADGTPGLITSTYTAYHPVYNFEAQSFYRKPNNSDLREINYNTPGTRGLPIYTYPSTYPFTNPQSENSASSEEVVRTENKKNGTRNGEGNDKRLLLLYVNGKNEHTRSSVVTGDFDNNPLTVSSFSKILNAEDGLHILFPKVVKEKDVLGQFIITPSNQIINKQIISNNLRWNFKYYDGVQIDDHSIVFPGTLHGYLCFARLEFE